MANPVEVLKVRAQALGGLTGHQHHKSDVGLISTLRRVAHEEGGRTLATTGLGTSIVRGMLGPGHAIALLLRAQAALLTDRFRGPAAHGFCSAASAGRPSSSATRRTSCEHDCTISPPARRGTATPATRSRRFWRRRARSASTRARSATTRGSGRIWYWCSSCWSAERLSSREPRLNGTGTIPRHRARAGSMAWRSTRRSRAN